MIHVILSRINLIFIHRYSTINGHIKQNKKYQSKINIVYKQEIKSHDQADRKSTWKLFQLLRHKQQPEQTNKKKSEHTYV